MDQSQFGKFEFHLGNSADKKFVQGLNISPQMVYADTLFGTGNKRTGESGSYQDGKAAAADFTLGMVEAVYDILPPNGTFWLHCNEKSDYIYRQKLNEVFGKGNFLAQIAWCYSSGGASKSKIPMKHDTIFWFAKNAKAKEYTYNPIRVPYDSLRPGETREGFHPDGKFLSSAWTDIGIISTTGKERRGYPTQKPVKLLERIVTLSSNEGDLILDPCCGSATTIDAAVKMGRDGVGIDINPEAIEVGTQRLVELTGCKNAG